MTKDKNRIETPNQWTRTINEYAFQAKVKEGKNFLDLKLPLEFQGHRLTIDVSRQGRARQPIAPFRVEYILLNPFAMFDDRSSLAADSVEHSGLRVADHLANKWMQFSYKIDEELTNKEARLSWKMSDGQLKRLVVELAEPDATLAVYAADKVVSGVLDYISFSKEIPIDIHHVEVYESRTNELFRMLLVVPYNSKVEVDEQLLSGVLMIPPLLVPLFRLFREATNSTNPYYRMLCLYRIGEGLRRAIRPRNNQKVKESELAQKRPKQRIPKNEFTKTSFAKWIGRPVDDFLDHVEHNFRKYIAHLIVNESLNWVPDPGTTRNANETDLINSMLFSIIRQLMVDEWTFMQANRIE
jgi:hypothetical protein